MMLDPLQVHATGDRREELIQPGLQSRAPAKYQQEMHFYLAGDMQPKWGVEKSTRERCTAILHSRSVLEMKNAWQLELEKELKNADY